VLLPAISRYNVINPAQIKSAFTHGLVVNRVFAESIITADESEKFYRDTGDEQ
jgi:hypothetical protein